MHTHFQTRILQNAGLGVLKGITFKGFLWPEGWGNTRTKQDFLHLYCVGTRGSRGRPRDISRSSWSLRPSRE